MRLPLAMQMLRSFCQLALLVSFIGAQGQSVLPNSQQQGKKQAHYAPRHLGTQKGKTRVRHTPQYEFYKRVEQAAKEKQRIFRKLSKAQFSNPLYFGHKRIPKRHPSHKIRYCRECGIRH